MKLYRAFLVRCWCESQAEPPVWRFAVIEVGSTSQMRGFADWEQLLRYLSSEYSGNALEQDAAETPTENLSRTASEQDKGEI